jgi:hypothetical protein
MGGLEGLQALHGANNIQAKAKELSFILVSHLFITPTDPVGTCPSFLWFK